MRVPERWVFALAGFVLGVGATVAGFYAMDRMPGAP